MATFQFPRGMTVTTFYAPPVGFNPLHANEAELRQYGFPPRDAWFECHVRAWERRAKNHAHRYIEASFGKDDQTISRTRPMLRTHGTEMTSTNWSGSVLSAPSGRQWRAITGAWRIPSPQPAAPYVAGGIYPSVSWIGLDGAFGDTDVLQIEIAHIAIAGDSGVPGSTEIYAVFEWNQRPYTTNQNVVNGKVLTPDGKPFPVSAGDDVNASIAMDPGSASSGTVDLENSTLGVSTTFKFSLTNPTPGTVLVGNCAEWIVERQGLGYFNEEIENRKQNASASHTVSVLSGLSFLPFPVWDHYLNSLAGS
jgi:hypothetical protein